MLSVVFHCCLDSFCFWGRSWGGEIVNSGIQHLNLYEKIILVEKLDCCVINSTVKLYSSKHSAALLKHTAVCAFETEGFLEGGELLSSGE